MFISMMIPLKLRGGEGMDFELIEEAKEAKSLGNGCCISDIWTVFMPDTD